MHKDNNRKIELSLIVVLRLEAQSRSVQDLATLVEQSLMDTLTALNKLSRQGLVICTHQAKLPLWKCGTVGDRMVNDMAQEIQKTFPENSLPYNYSLLCGNVNLAACERMAHFLDARVKRGERGVLLCLEILLRALLQWGALHQGEKNPEHRQYVELVLAVQGMCIFTEKFLNIALSLTPYAQNVASSSGNTRLSPVINIFRNYMQHYIPSKIRYAEQENQTAFEELLTSADEDMASMLPAFKGLLHYIRGDYRVTLQCYSQRYEMQHWLYKYFFIAFSLASSQSAMYLKQYHLCIGINESERHNAEIANERFLYLLWRSIFCFVLLRKGDFDEAIVHIDYLICTIRIEDGYNVFSSTIRALALYHYMYGRIDAAYRVLLQATLLAKRKATLISPFRDPLVLNMLFAFEEQGYAPIPGYELTEVIEHFICAPNTQLRATALRIRALRRKREEGYSDAVESILHECFHYANMAGDPAEISLALYELANYLEKKSPMQSRRLRSQTIDIIGIKLENGLTQRAAVILATCGYQSLPGVQYPRPISIPTPIPLGENSIQERCFRAFKALPLGDSLSDALGRLLNVIQLELACERVLLLCGKDVTEMELVASTNMSVHEYHSTDMRDSRKWIARHAGTKARFALRSDRQALCINLDDEDAYWVLYLHNTVTSSVFFDLPTATIEELARLCALEVRLIRCVQHVREGAMQRHWEKVLRTDEQQGRETPSIIGNGLKPVYEQAHRVSMTDAPVLLLGETGVGKEILARYIHQSSGRSGPFVPIHLASTQELLFESELFGYERGAFTGAQKQKMGLLEVADHGTLFIDEVGDIPPNVQTKLLRVLQDHRFMRVGGIREIHTNFRLIAATHKDLWAEVAKGRFRKDLLYRISVVPLLIPSLRERQQDIVPLAQGFVNYFCARYGISPLKLSAQQVRKLCNYEWLGNVRELKNCMERAVILCNGGILEIVLPSSSDLPSPMEPSISSADEVTLTNALTLPEVEARYLRQILTLTDGKVRGPQGAESILKMKRSTLYAKLRKYGISTS